MANWTRRGAAALVLLLLLYIGGIHTILVHWRQTACSLAAQLFLRYRHGGRREVTRELRGILMDWTREPFNSVWAFSDASLPLRRRAAVRGLFMAVSPIEPSDFRIEITLAAALCTWSRLSCCSCDLSAIILA